MMNHHNNHIRLTILGALCMTGLLGCAGTAEKLDKPVHTLFEEKGWNKNDSKNIKRALEDTNLFGQISLAALLKKGDKDPKNAFTEPSPCIFKDSPDSSNLSGKWNALVDEMQKQDIINRSLPLNAEQRAEALELLTSGKAEIDIKDSLANIAEVLYGLKSGGAQKIVTTLSSTDHAEALFTAMKKDIQLRMETGLGRKHIMVNTAEVVNSGAIGSIVSDTVNIFIKKDNRTMRLAIIAYARMNGINITEQNLNDLGTALSQDSPDFYPLLASLMDTMKKEYGFQDLVDTVSEIKRRDQECRPSAT
jgi:hypothetical protein